MRNVPTIPETDIFDLNIIVADDYEHDNDMNDRARRNNQEGAATERIAPYMPQMTTTVMKTTMIF